MLRTRAKTAPGRHGSALSGSRRLSRQGQINVKHPTPGAQDPQCRTTVLERHWPWSSSAPQRPALLGQFFLRPRVIWAHPGASPQRPRSPESLQDQIFVDFSSNSIDLGVPFHRCCITFARHFARIRRLTLLCAKHGEARRIATKMLARTLPRTLLVRCDPASPT